MEVGGGGGAGAMGTKGENFLGLYFIVLLLFNPEASSINCSVATWTRAEVGREDRLEMLEN